MKYTDEELQQMAQQFLGMLNAGVDIRPRAVMLAIVTGKQIGRAHV